MSWPRGIVGYINLHPILKLLTPTAYLYSAATISGAFGGVIAYGVQVNLTYAATGRQPWQWLFIIEGSMAILGSLLVILLLPRFPDDLESRGKKHWLFTAEEIDIAAERCACKFKTETWISAVLIRI
jgi:hypothetical protein